MLQMLLIEVAIEFAIVHIGRAVMIAADGHSLILYVSGSAPGKWIAAGRRRPFRTEATIQEIMHEAQLWAEMIDVAADHSLAIATGLDPERLALG